MVRKMDSRYAKMSTEGLAIVVTRLGLESVGVFDLNEYAHLNELDSLKDSGQLTEAESIEWKELDRRETLRHIVRAYERGELDFLMAVDIEDMSPKELKDLIEKRPQHDWIHAISEG